MELATAISRNRKASASPPGADQDFVDSMQASYHLDDSYYMVETDS